MRVSVIDTVGPAIRRLRRARRLNQTSFAERAGIEKSLMSKIEVGAVKATIEHIFRAAMALEVLPSKIMLEAESLAGDVNSRDFSFLSPKERDKVIKEILEDR